MTRSGAWTPQGDTALFGLARRDKRAMKRAMALDGAKEAITLRAERRG